MNDLEKQEVKNLIDTCEGVVVVIFRQNDYGCIGFNVDAQEAAMAAALTQIMATDMIQGESCGTKTV